MNEQGEITKLLDAWILSRDNAAFDEVYRKLAPQLKRIVRRYLITGTGQDVSQATALLGAVFERLIEDIRKNPGWQNRNHFFAHIAITARQVAVEALRKHTAAKRGGLVRHVSTADGDIGNWAAVKLATLQIAIDEFKAKEPELYWCFMLKTQFRRSYDELADLMQISRGTAIARVDKAKRALQDLMQTIPPDTAYRFIKNLDEEQ